MGHKVGLDAVAERKIPSSETLVTTFKTTWRHNPDDTIHVFTAVKTSNIK
jgi:hypothetical protein